MVCVHVCEYVSGLCLKASLLRGLTSAILRHIDQHRPSITDIDSLSSVDELAQIAALATVNKN